MTLTLKVYQLLQAISFASDEGDLELQLTLKELQDGVYVWRTSAPEQGSLKLAETPPKLTFELEPDYAPEPSPQAEFDFAKAYIIEDSDC